MDKYLIFGKKREKNIEGQVPECSRTLSEKRKTDDNLSAEQNRLKKRERCWDEKWKEGRPWLDLNSDNFMICTWCRKYTSTHEKAHKSAFIRG